MIKREFDNNRKFYKCKNGNIENLGYKIIEIEKILDKFIEKELEKINLDELECLDCKLITSKSNELEMILIERW